LSEETTDVVCYLGTGRRKTSVAQVRLFDGKGLFIVNNKPYDEYFTVGSHINTVVNPLVITGTRHDFDIKVKVRGGGPTGQAGAISLGISRALAKISHDNHQELKKKRLLTRDSRMVERKKPGCHKARRGKQFSKR
jgi:small subunit ribosomal protein S9